MSNRNLRMSKVFNFDAFNFVPKHIIGVGAIGGMVCKQLAYMGIDNVHLWDFDTVEEHNMGNQGFKHSDEGELKVRVRGNEAYEYKEEGCNWVTHNERWEYTTDASIYFCCVDSLTARKQIYDTIPETALLVDTRMLSLNYAVYALKGKSDKYEESLDPEGLVEGDCTSRSTLHAANLAATLAITQAMHSISGRDVPFLIKGDLLTYEQGTEWTK